MRILTALLLTLPEEKIKMKKKIFFIHCNELEKLKYEGCPFDTSRAGKTLRILQTTGLFPGPGRELARPEPASRAEVEKFHTIRYLNVLSRAAKGSIDEKCLEMGLGTADCPFFADMYEYPLWAAGASLLAARLITSGRAQTAFNPSGGFHHAFPGRAGGFCYINDIVLACLELAGAGMKVMVIDIDIHHGDAVQAAFYNRDDIMTLSFHESGRILFPGTGFVEELGEGRGRGYAVNVPLPANTYDEAYLHVFETVTSPLMKVYNPDVIVLEIGLDGLAGDPLGHFKLTNNVYADVISFIMKSGKPVLAAGGGGYNIENTARGWALAWSVFCGEDSKVDSMLGLGGVMLQTSEWQGGLRDRVLVPDEIERKSVDKETKKILAEVKNNIFPIHGI